MKNRSMRKVNYILLAFVASAVSAHPHIGIDILLEPQTANGILQGVAVTWVFDREAFDLEMISDYDPDGNQVLDKYEMEHLRIRAFENIIDQSYYLYLKSSDGPIDTPVSEQFSAEISEDHMIYHFYLPYQYRYVDSPRSRPKRFTFILQDPTGFMELHLREFKPRVSKGNDPVDTFFTSERWVEFIFNHGQDYVSEMLVQEVQFFPTRN